MAIKQGGLYRRPSPDKPAELVQRTLPAGSAIPAVTADAAGPAAEPTLADPVGSAATPNTAPGDATPAAAAKRKKGA